MFVDKLLRNGLIIREEPAAPNLAANSPEGRVPTSWPTLLRALLWLHYYISTGIKPVV